MYYIQQVSLICETFGWRCVTLDDHAMSIFVFDNYGAEYNILVDEFEENIRCSISILHITDCKEVRPQCFEAVTHANNLINAGFFIFFENEIRVVCDLFHISEENIEQSINILISHYNNFKTPLDLIIKGQLNLNMMEYLVTNESGIC